MTLESGGLTRVTCIQLNAKSILVDLLYLFRGIIQYVSNFRSNTSRTSFLWLLKNKCSWFGSIASCFLTSPGWRLFCLFQDF